MHEVSLFQHYVIKQTLHFKYKMKLDSVQSQNASSGMDW